MSSSSSRCLPFALAYVFTASPIVRQCGVVGAQTYKKICYHLLILIASLRFLLKFVDSGRTRALGCPTHVIGFLTRERKMVSPITWFEEQGEQGEIWVTSWFRYQHTILTSFPSLFLSPYILDCAFEITSQVSRQHPGLVWGSALGRSQTKTASSAMRPSSSTCHMPQLPESTPWSSDGRQKLHAAQPSRPE